MIHELFVEEISLDEGKYTLCMRDDGRFWAKQCGKDWLELNAQPGSKMFIAMFYKLQELERYKPRPHDRKICERTVCQSCDRW